MFARLHVTVSPAEAGLSAYDLAQALWARTPSIFVRSLMADIGLLQIDFRRVSDETAEWICDCIVAAVTDAQKSPRKSQASAAAGPSPNLADISLASLERWPLAMKV
jgi:hypothetical protein